MVALGEREKKAMKRNGILPYPLESQPLVKKGLSDESFHEHSWAQTLHLFLLFLFSHLREYR